MKLSKDTITIFENFAAINPSIVFYAGNWQRSISREKTIMAEATVAEDFPKDFAIFDMNQFLSVLSMFSDDPDLTFEDKRVIIQKDSQKVSYNFSDASLIKTIPKDKKIPFDDVIYTVDISKDIFDKVMKMARILRSENVAFVSSEGKVHFRTVNLNDAEASNASLEIGTAEEEFNMVINVNNLKLLTADYKIEFSKKKLVRINTTTGPGVTYIVPCAQESTFKGK